MFHLRTMLRQLLANENIPNLREWEETLLKIALRIARELTFTAHPHRQGADMDVRRYVKIKKIPGGAPRDSEYVDGAVITKNVAHKAMLRTQHYPRVMLVTFPLEFHRIEGQYVHFGQILLQEKDYLGNLAARIAALRPHVVLVEKSVSRLALDALAAKNIAVARAVKPSAIQCVARMTQGDVFSSMDKLALEPRLGHCKKFKIQTFDHPLIPGRRKTYMRFEGCNREMGCTIILRGGDIDVLRRVKKVTRFLAFIVRNLRLETHLWKDSVITLPPLSKIATPGSSTVTEGAFYDSPGPATEPLPSGNDSDKQAAASLMDVEELHGEEAEQRRLTHRIDESLQPYEKTFISVSATLRFPPPYPIRRMKELDDELIQVKQEWEDDLVRREERPVSGHEQEETITEMSSPAVILPISAETDDLAAQIESLPLPMSITPTPSFLPPPDGPDYFSIPRTSSSQTLLPPSIVASPAPIILDEHPIAVKTVEEIELESRYTYVKWQHEEQRRIWEWYLRKNKDDFDVEKYQCISMWEFTLPIDQYGENRACFPPQLQYITFYGENDCTLGQYIERSIRETRVKSLDQKAICEGKGCGQSIARHAKVFVHNETRLLVATEQWEAHITDLNGYHAHGSQDPIITWSACQVCGSATPFIPVSEEMQRYSFAKFLELHFYPADVQLVQGAGCQHNIYRHHVRYFASQGMTVRFQAEPITLHEIVYPPMRIRVRPEAQLSIKNKDFSRLHERNHMWYSALIDDLKLINIDAATGEEDDDAILTAQINTLILRAEGEKTEMTRFINKIYSEAGPTDTIALNQVRARRQDLIVAWQQDFDRLPKPRLTQQLTDRNLSRMSAFGTVRSMWPKRGGFDFTNIPSANVSEAEEFSAPGPSQRRVTGDSFTSTSSASEHSENESNADETTTRSETVTGDAITTDSPDRADGDSDSTIGAGGGEGPTAPEITGVVSPYLQGIVHELNSTIQFSNPEDDLAIDPARPSRVVSRLPRRAVRHPSVAELVQKYQEYLPPQGVEELARTALSPTLPTYDSEAEPPPLNFSSRRPKSKTRGPFISKKASTSDFEYGYAANIAPKYLTHRRPAGQPQHTSRIPGPIASSFDSRQTSRRSSPDKRPSFSRMHQDSTIRGGRISPPPGKLHPMGPFVSRGKGKSTIRAASKDKPVAPRSTSVSGPKNTVKRPVNQGSKVSNIAKHFERINRDNERANRRYAVIRGRRARPVATARAKVEILESIKDAINDDESDESNSSEADDEGGDEEESHSRHKPSTETSSTNSTHPPIPAASEGEQPQSSTDEVPPAPKDPPAIVLDAPKEDKLAERPTPLTIPPSVPPSPAFLPQLAASPPELDLGGIGERTSILKTLAGFWPQQTQAPRHVELDDPMSDPEHIFRDSSMVVRTDEPTSIIALALK